jgi:hypothetical protein
VSVIVSKVGLLLIEVAIVIESESSGVGGGVYYNHGELALPMGIEVLKFSVLVSGL